jgi:hypothetical protein
VLLRLEPPSNFFEQVFVQDVVLDVVGVVLDKERQKVEPEALQMNGAAGVARVGGLFRQQLTCTRKFFPALQVLLQ